MFEIKKITYYAHDYMLGYYSTKEACDKFREWAEKQIEEEYPEFEVNVSSEMSQRICSIDGADYDTEAEIMDFCNDLFSESLCRGVWE